MDVRLQKYKKNRLAGMDQKNAAIAAGYSESYAVQACRIEKQVKVSLRDSFERAGLTDKALVSHALKGMEANKVISCNVIAQDGEGMKDANSMTKDFVDVPDWTSRHKYFESVCKLTDRLKDKNDSSVSKETKVFIIQQSGDSVGIKDNCQAISVQVSQ